MNVTKGTIFVRDTTRGRREYLVVRVRGNLLTLRNLRQPMADFDEPLERLLASGYSPASPDGMR